MDAGLIILYLIELVIVFVFGIVIFFKKRELDELDETCNYLRIKASSNSPLDSNAMLKVIQEKGYFPTRDPDGNIEFKIQGTTGSNGLEFFQTERSQHRKSIICCNQNPYQRR